MKKMIFAVMAIAAISFTTSCGNKTQQAGEAVDSVALVDSLAEAAAQEDINAISGLFESGDAAKLQETLAAVKEKVVALIKENPEIAKEYVAKVQNFLKENADKVKAVIGDNAAAAAAFAAVTEADAESMVNGLLQSVSDAAEDAKDAATEAVEDAKDAAVDAAKEKANEAVDAAADKAKEAMGL